MGEWPFDASRGLQAKKLGKLLGKRSGLLAASSALAVLSHKAAAQESGATQDLVSLSEIDGIASFETLANGDLRLIFENGQEMIIPAGQLVQGAGGFYVSADVLADIAAVAEAGGGLGAIAPILALAGLVTSSGLNGSTPAPTPTPTPTNNAPVFTSPNSSQAAENQTAAGVTATASDADGDTLSYAITGGADAALFTIDPASGVLGFVNAPDFESPADAGANNVYDVQITANDGNGASVAQAVSVTVSDVDENVAPQITSTPANTVDENIATPAATIAAVDANGDTVAFAISGGADAALFSIDAASGELSFISAPDFELPSDADADNSYEVTVTASDGNGGITSQNMTITVADVDETGEETGKLFGPSAAEQMLVELVNRARANPGEELGNLVPDLNPENASSPNTQAGLEFFQTNLQLIQDQLASRAALAPLAWSDELGASATQHSQLMVDNDQQLHNFPGEPGLLLRIAEEGYSAGRAIENIFAYAQNPEHAHAAFFIDYGPGLNGIQETASHREALLDPNVFEIGVGIVSDGTQSTFAGPFVTTQHFGSRADYAQQLVGVIFRDFDENDFYGIGEGVGAVTVIATGAAGTFTTQSWASGGYQIELPDGDYTISFSGDTLGSTLVRQVTVSGSNVKVDLDLPGSPDLISVALQDDNGTPDDQITNDAAIGIAALAGVGLASLSVSLDGGSAVDIFANLGADGTLRIEPAAFGLNQYAAGAHSVIIEAVDVNGLVEIETLNFTFDADAPNLANVRLAPSSDTGERGDGITSQSWVALTGEAEAGTIVSLGDQTIIVPVSGRFQLADVDLASGANSLQVQARDTAGNLTTQTLDITVDGGADGGSPVLAWIEVSLQAIKLSAAPGTVATRVLAMESVAVLDAIAAIDGTPGYLTPIEGAEGGSVEAAIAVAAHTVLVNAFPDQRTMLDAALAEALSGLPRDAAYDAGLNAGLSAAMGVIDAREFDGTDAYENFIGGTDAGEWRPTGPMFEPGITPQYGEAQTWIITSPDQFAQGGPPALDSAEYATALASVQAIGEAGSASRTEDMSDAVIFWTAGGGTFTTPGHWNDIALTFTQAEGGTSIAEHALLFASLNVALADTAIAAWDEKYDEAFWRPSTAITNADQDGNAATIADPNWRPFLIDPSHPEYVSGHASFSGAAATVLASFFGDENSIDVRSEDSPNVTRTYSSFSQIAQEQADSREWAGVHFSFSNEDGLDLGEDVAELVLGSFTRDNDGAPPVITLDGGRVRVADGDVTLTGRVSDFASGVAALSVSINGGAAVDLPISSDGRFSLLIADDGDPQKTVTFVASDASGNVTQPVSVDLTIDSLAPVITLDSFADGAVITADTLLAGMADPTGTSLVSLRYSIDGGEATPINFDHDDGSFSDALILGDLAPGAHNVSVTARDQAGNVTTQDFSVSMDERIPFELTSVEPQNDLSNVGVTKRPQITFSRPVDPDTVTHDTFYVVDASGERLDANIVVARDGMRAFLFLSQPMPGNSRITLTLDGDAIKAASDGAALDGDGNGTAGGAFELDFTTVGTSDLSGTSIEGRLFGPGADLTPMTRDDFRAGDDRTPFSDDDEFLNPIAGARVFILGREDIVVLTDENGYFRLDDIPSGNVKLAVDGRSATNAPDGFFFPEMVMDLDIEPGRLNTVMESMGSQEQRAGNLGRDEVYLPQLSETMLRDVVAGSDTEVGLADAGVSEELSPEQIASVKLVVDGSSLIGEDGQPMDGGQVGIATVPPELVRDMLPAGLLQHTFDITIQAPGVAAFDEPAALTVPNVFGAEPGTQLNFLSFDHTTGRLIIEGTATVSPDGMTVTTDPGTGITKPGWHGITPPGSETEFDGKDPAADKDANAQENADAEFVISGLEADLTNALGRLNDIRKRLDDPKTGLLEIKDKAGALIKIGSSLDTLVISGIDKGDTADTARTFVKALEDLTGGIDTVTGDGFVSIGINGENLGKAVKDLQELEPIIQRLKDSLAGALEPGSSLHAGCVTAQDITRLQNRLDAALAVQEELTLQVEIASGSDSVQQLLGFLGGGSPVAALIKEQIKAGLLTLKAGIEIVDRRGDQIDLLTRAQQAEIDGNTELADRLYDAAYARSNIENGEPAFAAASEQSVFDILLIDDVFTQEEQDVYFTAIEAVSTGLQQLIELAVGDDDGVEVSGIVDELIFGFEQFDEIETIFTPILAGIYGYPVDSAYRISGGSVDIRGTTDSNGVLNVFLPAEVDLLLEIYDAKNNLIARSEFTTNRSGQPTSIPDPQISVVGLLEDTDGDLLVDEAELIVGTSVTRADTDGDGISDYQELLNGTNPVGIFGPVTGPVASVDLGSAIFDIEVVRFETGAITRIGLVATQEGISIVNLTGAQPELISSIALNSRANDIAVDPLLGVMVVSTAVGLQVYDISKPIEPVQVDAFSGSATQLEIVDGQIVYVDGSDDLIVRDLISGEITSELSLGTGILEIARDGGRLYIGRADDQLTIVDIDNGGLIERGTIASGTANNFSDLIAGQGDAFGIVTSFNGGIISFDVRDPDNPTVIESVINGGYPEDALALGGTGLALIAGFNGLENSVELYDLSDPANLTQLITRFPFDARPTAAAMAGGLGYIGDASGLLTLINYVSPDVGEIAPTITLAVDAFDRDPNTDGIQAIEGDSFTVIGSADDDVEIARVELLIDGAVSTADITFPYGLDGHLPFLSEDANGDGLAQLQLRAIDTGGNIGLSNVIEIEFGPDSFAPEVISTSPSDDSVIRFDNAAFVVRFDEDIDFLSLDLDQAFLTSANDPSVTYEAISATLSLSGSAVIYRFEELEQGDLLLTFDPAGISDLLGNVSTADAITLNVMSAAITQTYIGTDDGSWFDAGNWSEGRVPDASDVVLIGTGVTVTIAGGQAESSQIFVNSGTLLLQSGSLDAGAIDAGDSGFTMTGGTLFNASVISDGQLNMRGTLDNVTLESAATLTNGGTLTIENGLTVNDTLEIAGASAFTQVIAGSGQTIGGTGSIKFVDEANGARINRIIVGENDGEDGTLTFGPELTIEGDEGQIIGAFGANDSISVLGTIKTNGAIDFGVDVDNGGAALALDSGDGRILFERNLDNVRLVSAAPSVSLTISNGSNIVSDVDMAIFGTANLANLTANGDVTITNGVTLTITDGLTINGTLDLAGTSSFTRLAVGSGETIEGSGTIRFLDEENGARLNAVIIGENDGERGTVTFGPDLTLEGQEGQIAWAFGSNDTVTVLGTVKTTSATDFIDFAVDVDNGGAALTLDDGEGRIVFTRGLDDVQLVGAGSLATLSGADGSNVVADIDIAVLGTTSLANSTTNSLVTVTNGSTLNITDGLTINGTLEIAGASAFTQVVAGSNQTIDGTGSIVFLDEENGARINRLIIGENDGERGILTFGQGLTIEGQEGQMLATFGSNDAVQLLGPIKTADATDSIDFDVDVDNAGSALIIDSGDGRISFNRGVDNVQFVGANSTVSLSGATGSNITFNTEGAIITSSDLTDISATSNIAIAGATSVTNLSTTGDVTLTNGATLTANALDLNGTLTVAGTSNFTSLALGSGQEVTGTGTIHLNGENNGATLNTISIGDNDGASGNVAFGAGITLSGEEGAIVRAFGATDTISIGGTITAQNAGDTLVFNVDINNGGNSFTADAGLGRLIFNAAIIDAQIGGPAGSIIELRNSRAEDVTFNVEALLGGTTELDGVVITGDARQENGSNITVTNGLTLGGEYLIDGTSSFTLLNLLSDQTIDGDGSIRFSEEFSGSAINQIRIGENDGNTGLVIFEDDIELVGNEGLISNAANADDEIRIDGEVIEENGGAITITVTQQPPVIGGTGGHSNSVATLGGPSAEAILFVGGSAGDGEAPTFQSAQLHQTASIELNLAADSDKAGETTYQPVTGEVVEIYAPTPILDDLNGNRVGEGLEFLGANEIWQSVGFESSLVVGINSLGAFPAAESMAEALPIKQQTEALAWISAPTINGSLDRAGIVDLTDDFDGLEADLIGDFEPVTYAIANLDQHSNLI